MRKLVLIISIVLSIGLSASAQNAGVGVGSEPAVPRPADEARIGSSIPLYKVNSRKFEDLEKLKTPEVQFEFSDDTRKLSDLSPAVRDILDRHWKKALKFFYDEQFSKPMNVQEAYDRNIEWLKTCNRTHNELMQTEIAAPQGKRKISYTEAEQTFGFINRVAKAVIERAKNVKPEFVS